MYTATHTLRTLKYVIYDEHSDIAHTVCVHRYKHNVITLRRGTVTMYVIYPSTCELRCLRIRVYTFPGMV